MKDTLILFFQHYVQTPHPDWDYREREMNSIISNKIFQSINMDLRKDLIVQTNSFLCITLSHMSCGEIPFLLL